MALRRVLPSRLTGAPPPEDTLAPSTSSSPVNSAPAPAQPAPSPVPQPAPQAAEVSTPTEAQVAAAASSAFSTLPSTPKRVLEDSFSTPAPTAAPQQVEAAPAPQPAPEVAPEAVTAPTPQVEKPAEAAPSAAEPVAEKKAESPAPQQAAPQRPEPQAPAENRPQPSRPQNNPLKRRAPGRGEDRPRKFQSPAGQNAERSSQQAPSQLSRPNPPSPDVSEYQPAAAPQSGTRRQREKKPRDFAAATVAPSAPAATLPSSGTSRMDPSVPVDTRPLDRVDEELIASGIIAPPPGDDLVSNVPVGAAESESPFADNEPALPEPYSSPATAVHEEPSPTPGLPAQPVQAPLPPAASAALPPRPTGPLVMPDLPSSGSNLPWANDAPVSSDWDVDLPQTAAPADSSATALSPPADFFKPTAGTPAPSGPAWAVPQNRGAAPTLPPPELHGSGKNGRMSGFNRGSSSVWGLGLVAVAVGVIALFIWSSGRKQSDLQEKVARWTGSLNEQTENLSGANGGVRPESTFSMAQLGSVSPSSVANGALLPPPAVGAMASMPNQPGAQSNAQIDFADVPPDQAAQPIVADGSETMPEDVSLFAKFQRAVANARAEKGGAPGSSAQQQAAAPSSPDADENLTPEKLQSELAAYRKSLTETDNTEAVKAAVPTAAAFNRDPDAYMDGKPLASTPVDASAAAGGSAAGGQQSALLPPPELYTNNPKKLPIMGEPVANAPAQVRQLSDFKVEPFAPEKPKVEIPRGLKPRLATTDFPSVEVLSFVPDRGIIAYASGREGVLLIGQTLEGWQLTKVTTELAEFRAGSRHHYVTVND